MRKANRALPPALAGLSGRTESLGSYLSVGGVLFGCLSVLVRGWAVATAE